MSAASFSQFLATLSGACLVASPHGDILDLNPTACGVLGYRKEELLGKPLPSIFAPESHSKVVEQLEKLNITRTLFADKMNVLIKKGEKRIMLLSMGSAVGAEGRLLYSTTMLVDISDQERDTEEGGAGRLITLNLFAFDALVLWARRFSERGNEHYVFPWCEHRQTDATRPTKGWRTAWRHALKLWAMSPG